VARVVVVVAPRRGALAATLERADATVLAFARAAHSVAPDARDVNVDIITRGVRAMYAASSARAVTETCVAVACRVDNSPHSTTRKMQCVTAAPSTIAVRATRVVNARRGRDASVAGRYARIVTNAAGEVSFRDGPGTAFMTMTPKEAELRARVSDTQQWIDAWVVKTGTFDFGAVVKYIAATAFEVGAITTALFAAQKFCLGNLHATSLGAAKAIVAVMFFMLAFRSRVFSPLNASRPKIANERKAKQERKRPSWTPPAVVFPLVWISMGFLRSLSTMMVFATTGTVVHPAIIALVAHLSIGDTWNSINNVEKKLGAAAVGVLFVVSSAYNVVAQYYNVIPTAGYVIAPLAVWLTIASALVWNIWAINGKQPLYPTKPRAFN
jgi:translocator protein